MHWVCGTAPESGSCLWSPRSLLEDCASEGLCVPATQAELHLEFAFQKVLDCICTLHLALAGNGSGPSAAQRRLLFPRIIWGLSRNVGFGSVLEEKGDNIIIWVAWFRKDSQITDWWSTYFTSMNFCGKWRLAWEWSNFKGNRCVDWLMLQWLPQKML